MNAFATLVADFAEKTGVEPGKLGADNFDVEADGVVVSAQYRAERDDCVIFSRWNWPRTAPARTAISSVSGRGCSCFPPSCRSPGFPQMISAGAS